MKQRTSSAAAFCSLDETTRIPQWWPRLVNMDNAVNLLKRKTLVKRMETLPQCDLFFIFFFDMSRNNRNKRGKKKTSKEIKLHMWQWSCQKPYNKLENELFQGIVVTFTFIITFSKAWQTVKEPCDGWYGLVSFATSPHPKPSSHALPWLLDSSLPHIPSLHRTESHNSRTGRVQTCL